MATPRIEKTSIWKNTLAEKTPDDHKAEREKLRNAFRSLRENTTHLVSRISSTLPELTQHDISHLDALWETASLIVGENFEISPLEGFVLGCSFLLHDSALCFEAFENGKEGLRCTTQWKDAYADLKDNNFLTDDIEIQNQADFLALRNLHAQQAEKLLSHKWKDESTGNELYLLDDQGLRIHLGMLIGQIASSHHWNIEAIISAFNSQKNVPTGYPTEWRIDPVKIACILRCADAAHLDNERAPDFLHALLKRNGISLKHWIAQNRLAKVDIDQSDLNKTTLLFTSNIDFEEKDSDAWFVAYDAICLLDKEIKECNALLERRMNKTFQVTKVKGVESPEALSSFIKANHWTPCSAQVYIGNVERVIKNLGGHMLYGEGTDSLGIVLRETIQNARDSINARYTFDSSFDGSIVVKLEQDLDSTWLIIEDNGIGMSKRVLTGPLLDFGTSFWTSSLVQNEFPGLRSSRFKSIGKFGIGFYSVFMIAAQVVIVSKSYTDGLSNAHQLKFNNGFSLRPILTQGAPQDFNMAISTRIKIKLKPNIMPEDLLIDIQNNKMGATNFKVPFKEYLAVICAGLDVNVFFETSGSKKIKIHESILSDEFDKLKWLKTISFSEYQTTSTQVKEYIENNISRITPIIEGDVRLGLAAINTILPTNNNNYLSVSCIGGLANSAHSRDAGDFIGYINYLPKSAKRDAIDFEAPSTTLKNWAKKQLSELLALNLNPYEKYMASASLSKFKVDPSGLAAILVNYNHNMHFHSFEELAILSQSIGIAFLDSNFSSSGHMETYHDIQELSGYALVRPLTNSSFLSLKMNEEIPEENFSILDCLYRKIVEKGLIPKIEKIEAVGQNVFGWTLHALIVSSCPSNPETFI